MYIDCFVTCGEHAAVKLPPRRRSQGGPMRSSAQSCLRLANLETYILNGPVGQVSHLTAVCQDPLQRIILVMTDETCARLHLPSGVPAACWANVVRQYPYNAPRWAQGHISVKRALLRDVVLWKSHVLSCCLDVCLAFELTI